jgi:hypothetical protein
MIVEYIRYQTDPDRGGRLVEATAPPSPTSKPPPNAFRRRSRSAPRTRAASPCASFGPPSGAQGGLPQRPALPALSRPGAAFISDIAEMRHYQPVVAG